MKPESQKLRHQTEEQALHVEHSQSKEKGQEFATVEELLRYDARQNIPGPALAERVNASIANEPKRPLRWWQRLFKKSS